LICPDGGDWRALGYAGQRTGENVGLGSRPTLCFIFALRFLPRFSVSPAP